MKTLVALAGLALLTGCTEFLPEYYPDAAARPPKGSKYDPPILFSRPNRDYTVIGHTAFATWIDERKISRDLKTLARSHGADAILISRGAEENRDVPFTVQPSVEMRPVTTRQVGTATAMDSYGRTAQGTYTGTQTSEVPIVNPGYTGVRTRRVTNFYAYFIAFR